MRETAAIAARHNLHRQRRNQAKDSALASTGAEVKLAHGVTLLGKFDGEFASRAALVAALS
jgi:hypothetical protein